MPDPTPIRPAIHPDQILVLDAATVAHLTKLIDDLIVTTAFVSGDKRPWIDLNTAEDRLYAAIGLPPKHRPGPPAPTS